MLAPDILENHYQEYANQPDSWLANMQEVKASIVSQILKVVPLFTDQRVKPRVAVLGVSDPRYIPIHQEIFNRALRRKVNMTTFDIDTEHLSGAEGVVQHDVTKLFPSQPFDLVFSHALMKFLTPAEQIKVIKNSYEGLNKNGITMHIFHSPEIEGTSELRSWQHRADPEIIRAELTSHSIPTRKLTCKINSTVDWLSSTTVIIARK